MNMTARCSTAFALAFLALAACTPAERTAERPQSTASPALDSGISADTGGGQRALRNNNSVGNVSTPVAPAR